MAKRPKREGEGRPTKYRQEYCQDVIDHMAKGLSFETFAAVINVNVDTLYEWAKRHGEFSEAKIQAFNKNRLFWEQNGIDGMWTDGNQRFNSTAWIFNMKNRFGWRDRRDEEDTNRIHTVKIELPEQKMQQVISAHSKRLKAKTDDK